VIYAGVNGYLDPLPVDKARPFEDALLAALRTKHTDLLETIRASKDLSDSSAAALKAVVEGIAKLFV
jgi:F-type H+-transporting ATPase subunit alpha